MVHKLLEGNPPASLQVYLSSTRISKNRTRRKPKHCTPVPPKILPNLRNDKVPEQGITSIPKRANSLCWSRIEVFLIGSMSCLCISEIRQSWFNVFVRCCGSMITSFRSINCAAMGMQFCTFGEAMTILLSIFSVRRLLLSPVTVPLLSRELRRRV